MELNQKLQKLRKQRGMTQEELAACLYVSRTAISKWESGRGVPNIESLKQISCFFSVTLDELLSSGEALMLAEKQQKQTKTHVCDLVFGLVDVSMLLLLFLPLFAAKAEGSVQAASLITLSGIGQYLKVGYLSVVLGSVIVGVMTLAMQRVFHKGWIAAKTSLSLTLGILALLLFVISLQPYAAVFAFFMLAMKAAVLLRCR